MNTAAPLTIGSMNKAGMQFYHLSDLTYYHSLFRHFSKLSIY